jgi:hypothetical protein
MTENTGLSEVQSSESISSPANNTSSSSFPMDDYIHKSEANKIIHERTKEVASKAEARAYERAKAELAASQNSQNAEPTHNFNNSIGGMQGFNEDKIRQMIAENTQQQLQNQLHEMQQMGAWQNTAETFVNRIQAAKEKYPDLEQSLIDLGIAKHTDVVKIANSIENTADVMDHLRKNPEQLFMLSAFVKSGEMEMAKFKMQQLSNSIKANTSASSSPSASQPLSQLKASTIGTDSGEMTQADWRKKFIA